MSIPKVNIDVAPSNTFRFSNTTQGDLVFTMTESNNGIHFGAASAQSNSLFSVTASQVRFGGQNSNISFSNNVITASSISVQGDLNYTGALRQNGSTYIGSQFSNSSSNVFLLNSNLGIGTNNPSYALDVSGDINFSGTIRQNGMPFSTVGVPVRPTIDTNDAVNIDTTKNWSILGTTGPAWGAAIDGANADTAVATSIDTSNNVVIVGNYSGSTSTYNANSLTPSSFSLPTTSNSSQGAFVVKYDSTGATQWVAGIDGAGPEAARDVMVSAADSSIYMVGTFSNTTPTVYSAQGSNVGVSPISLGAPSNANQSAYVVKYDSTGTAKWAAYATGSAPVSIDAIATGSNVYASGSYTTAAPDVYNGGNGAISSSTVTTITGSRGTQGPGTGYVDSTSMEMFSTPYGVCIDPSGTNVYVADRANKMIRKIVVSTGVVTTLAGSGTATHLDGTGTNASFSNPFGICIDSTGTNLYVTDSVAHRVRKVVVASGVVSTIVGSGTATFLDGTGTSAGFNAPTGICIDTSSTFIYVSEYTNHRVRKIVVASNVVSTLAGSGTSTYADGTGSLAGFSYPQGLCLDSSGSNLYVADTNNCRIRKVVTSTGVVTTLAGSGAFSFADGTGTSAQFYYPLGVTIDTTNTNLYVGDLTNHRIRKIVIASGAVTTLAGLGPAGYVDSIGSVACFNSPAGVCLDPTDTNLFVADSSNNRIRKVAISTNAVTTLSGNGTAGYMDTYNKSNNGTLCGFNSPAGVCIDPTGTTVYVADAPNNRIRKILLSTGVVTTLAGSGTSSYADGVGTGAAFSGPYSICIDRTGNNVYVSDTANHRIRKIVVTTGVVTTLAGSGTATFVDGTGTTAGFSSPRGISIDASDNIYLADANNHRVRKIVASTGVVSTLAGSGTATFAEGTGTAAGFNAPFGVCFDSSRSNLYITDFNNNRIRQLVLSTNTVSTIAGASTATFADGTGSNARFNNPNGICIDSSNGSLYIADYNTNRIRKIVISSSIVSTIAGSGAATFLDGVGTSASIFAPVGVCIDPTDASLYLGDQSNNRVRKVVLSTSQVSTTAGKGTATFQDTPNGLFNGMSGVTVDPTTNNIVISEVNNNTIRKIIPSTGYVSTLAGTPDLNLASHNSPRGVVVDPTGTHVFVVDSTYNRIRKIVKATGKVSTLAGSGAATYVDGTGTNASFNSPYSICIDPTYANVYVADSNNNRIRKIDIATGVVTTLVGSGTATYVDGTGTGASFYNPRGIIIDPTGTNMYVSDTFNHRIRKVILATGVVTTLAGSGTGTFANGTGSGASFQYPHEICIDPTGASLYVVDQSNNRIRKIVISTSVVTTLAGSGTATFADGTGTNASFYNPWGVCIDSTGTNMYVGDTANHRIRKIVIATGVVTTFAGLGTSSYADGIGTNAGFLNPMGVSVDPMGVSLYVSDNGNRRIRAIDISSQAVTTVSGIGSASPFADTGASGLNASYQTPRGLCVDPTGTNLYAIDYNSNRVRKMVLATGVTTTVAGSTLSYSEGVGTNAYFRNPQGACIDPTGTAIYVADTMNHRIRKIMTSTGVVTTLAGSGTGTFANGTGTGASFYQPADLCIDSTGANIYVSDGYNNRIRKIEVATGIVTTLAGSGTATFANGTGTAASFNAPYGICIDQFGSNVYVAESNNNRIRKIVVSTGVVTTLAGSGTATFLDGTGVAAGFNSPTSLCIDPTSTNLYVADLSNNRIRKIVISSTVVSTIAGSGTGTFLDGLGTSAGFNLPYGIAIDPTGTNIYVSDQINYRIRKINVSTGYVSTVAGMGTATFQDTVSYDSHLTARFNQPSSICYDSQGNAYITDTLNHNIRKITPAGVTTVFAGSTSQTSGSTDGTGTTATFNNPTSISIDSQSNLYIADRGNHVIRKITSAGVVTTLAGLVGSSGSADGTGTNARFNNPCGIAVDSAQNVFVADTLNNTIRRINQSGSTITIAGSTVAGYLDALDTTARFNTPLGLSMDAKGNLYVCDSGNNRIRRITPAGVVSTVVGRNAQGNIDANGTLATFNQPTNIYVNSAGSLAYVTDPFENTLRQIDITTLSPLSAIILPAPISSSQPAYAIKYDAVGTAQFAVNINGSASICTSSALAVDSAENFYLTGTYTGTPTASSTSTGAITLRAATATASYIVKYNASGVPQWASSIDGTSTDTTTHLSVDSDQNVYVTGFYSSASAPPILYNAANTATITLPALQSASQAGFVAKYNATGTPVWVAIIDGVGTDRPNKVRLDSQGNVYVVGQYQSSATAPTLYNSDGSISTTTLPTPANTQSKGFVILYNNAGMVTDALQVDGSGAQALNDIDIDNVGNIFVVGNYSTAAPTVYNDKATNTNAVTLPTPQNNAAYLVKYSTAAQSNYNLLSTLNDSKNGFTKILTNGGPATTTINVKAADTNSANQTTFQLIPGQSATLAWFKKWYKMT